METDWKTYRLDELCEFTNGFAFKSTDYVPPSTETLEVFRMGYIQRGGGFKEDDTPVFVSRNYDRNLEKFFLRPGDITIAMTDMKDRVAILGNTAWIRDSNRFVLNQRVGCIRVKRPDLLEPRFLYFYSNWSNHINHLRSRANSGVQVNLSTSAIKESLLTVPPLPEQKSIAAVLGAIDDKIDLNRKMSETLQAMARAIFKAWFIDFEPVRAKMEGRWKQGQTLPGLPAHLYEYFPNHLANTVLGETPDSWQISALGKMLALVIDHRGKTPLKLSGDWALQGIPVLSAKNIKSTGMVNMQDIRFVAEDLYCRWMSTPLAAGDILLTSEGPLGEVYFLAHTKTFCLGQRLFGLRVDPSMTVPSYIYLWLRSTSGQNELHSRATGTTVLGIRQSELLRCKVLCPPQKVQHEFESFVRPFLDKIIVNAEESTALSAIRDLLLPKLISGEIHIKETERLVEGVV